MEEPWDPAIRRFVGAGTMIVSAGGAHHQAERCSVPTAWWGQSLPERGRAPRVIQFATACKRGNRCQPLGFAFHA